MDETFVVCSFDTFWYPAVSLLCITKQPLLESPACKFPFKRKSIHLYKSPPPSLFLRMLNKIMAHIIKPFKTFRSEEPSHEMLQKILSYRWETVKKEEASKK